MEGAPPPAAAPDLSLARRIAGGDTSAFELLMRRYNRRLYRLARAALRDDAEAQDALQEAYLCAYRAIGQFRGESTLATWLARLVLNECSARRRRALRRDNIVPIVSTDPTMDARSAIADSAESPEGHTARLQIRQALERQVSELPEGLRLVFVLRSIEEMSVEETAAALEISPEAVRTRHVRARSLLRAALAREMDLAQADLFEFGGRSCDRVVSAVLGRLAPPAPGK
jgi:RNA polymerase sigma factor (sigma-70 family)